MKVCYGNTFEQVKSLILERAKYQKVMIVFDDYVSNLFLKNFSSSIKDFCIFNNTHINNLDYNELNNGYKMIIYFCLAENYLKNAFNNNDFVNVFCPQDKNILPFLTSQNFIFNSSESYIVLERKTIDVFMISSLCCNHFLNFFQKLLNCENFEEDLISFDYKQNLNMQALIENINAGMFFYDLEIVVNTGLDYRYLVLLNLILVDAFIVLINSIKSQTTMIVDVYKSNRDDQDFIDKCYNLINNEILSNVVFLNYNSICDCVKMVKQNILDYVNVFSFTKEDIEIVIEKVKQFSKEQDGLMSMLYIYNIFGV